MITLRVKVTLTEEALGLASANPDLHREFVASKSADAEKVEEEMQAMPADELLEKATTVFPRLENGTPFAWDYQWKGFIKDSWGMLRRVKGSKCAAEKAYKKVIDGLIFPKPRQIPWTLGGPMATCTRSLRAQTAQGERVSLATSETIPAGSTCMFEIVVMDAGLIPAIRECFSYGNMRGFGQWRNSGKGRFKCEVTEVE
jgi:hypothetical protein